MWDGPSAVPYQSNPRRENDTLFVYRTIRSLISKLVRVDSDGLRVYDEFYDWEAGAMVRALGVRHVW